MTKRQASTEKKVITDKAIVKRGVLETKFFKDWKKKGTVFIKRTFQNKNGWTKREKGSSWKWEALEGR